MIKFIFIAGSRETGQEIFGHLRLFSELYRRLDGRGAFAIALDSGLKRPVQEKYARHIEYMTAEEFDEAEFPAAKKIVAVHEDARQIPCVMFYNVEYRLTLLHSSEFEKATGTSGGSFLFVQSFEGRYFSRTTKCKNIGFAQLGQGDLVEGCAYAFYEKTPRWVLEFVLDIV